jgi:hypothetical protein
MAGFDWVAVASSAPISLIPIAVIIFLVAMVGALLILVSSTALFIFYLLATVQRILRHRR